MSDDLTRGALVVAHLAELSRAQRGVFTLAQASEWQVPLEAIRAQVAAGRLRRLSPGVYFCANAVPGVAAQWWAALLASGEGAVLSHWTAAPVYGVTGRRGRLIEVSIPDTRQEVSLPGVRIRRSRLLPGKGTVYRGWPITTAPDTVLDLVGDMRSAHDVVALLTDACRLDVMDAQQILDVMGRRRRQRHRRLVADVLADVQGVESNLEHKYLVRVERAHGLPVARRQVKAWANGAPVRRDLEYEEYRTVVELDGRLGHEGSGRHRDRRRDNASTRHGKATLRYGHADLQEPCAVAREVAQVLHLNGWNGRVTSCPRCGGTV